MMIEQWKDTAFGTDFGQDFLAFIETTFEDELMLNEIYKHTDVKKYLDDPSLLTNRTDHNVYLYHSEFEQYIHFEDFIIALSVFIVERYLNGKIDLTKAYGSKVFTFNFEASDIQPIYEALQHIYNHPENYVLFELCLEPERKETLQTISEILGEFKKVFE